MAWVSSCTRGSKEGGLAAKEYSDPLELIGSLFVEQLSSSRGSRVVESGRHSKSELCPLSLPLSTPEVDAEDVEVDVELDVHCDESGDMAGGKSRLA